MIRFQRDSQRLVLQSGPTRIVLDKIASKALLEHKSLPWERDPVECPLSAISGARVSTATDDESKAEICSLTLVVQGGDGWVLAAADKAECNHHRDCRSRVSRHRRVTAACNS
jgi:hypothetical protein